MNLSNNGERGLLEWIFPKRHEFRQTNLTGVHLEDFDLSTTVMDISTILTLATYDQTTLWPPGIDPVARGAIYTGPNRLPVIASSASVFISENQLLSFAVNASDPDGNVSWFRYHGGSDELKFEINASTGLLSRNSSTGMDFRFRLMRIVTMFTPDHRSFDGIEMVDQNLSVTVTDENEQPENLHSIASLSVMENQSVGSFAGEFNATDQDANTILSYSLVSGQVDTGNGFFFRWTQMVRSLTAEVLNYESNATPSGFESRTNTMPRSRVHFLGCRRPE